MSCRKQVLGIEWEHHSWRPRVAWTETRLVHETDMWGRVVTNQHVACHKDEVCAQCGVTRRGQDCTCDPAAGDRCAIRIACLDAGREVVG